MNSSQNSNIAVQVPEQIIVKHRQFVTDHLPIPNQNNFDVQPQYQQKISQMMQPEMLQFQKIPSQHSQRQLSTHPSQQLQSMPSQQLSKVLRSSSERRNSSQIPPPPQPPSNFFNSNSSNKQQQQQNPELKIANELQITNQRILEVSKDLQNLTSCIQNSANLYQPFVEDNNFMPPLPRQSIRNSSTGTNLRAPSNIFEPQQSKQLSRVPSNYITPANSMVPLKTQSSQKRASMMLPPIAPTASQRQSSQRYHQTPNEIPLPFEQFSQQQQQQVSQYSQQAAAQLPSQFSKRQSSVKDEFIRRQSQRISHEMQPIHSSKMMSNMDFYKQPSDVQDEYLNLQQPLESVSPSTQQQEDQIFPQQQQLPMENQDLIVSFNNNNNSQFSRKQSEPQQLQSQQRLSMQQSRPQMSARQSVGQNQLDKSISQQQEELLQRQQSIMAEQEQELQQLRAQSRRFSARPSQQIPEQMLSRGPSQISQKQPSNNFFERNISQSSQQPSQMMQQPSPQFSHQVISNRNRSQSQREQTPLSVSQQNSIRESSSSGNRNLNYDRTYVKTQGLEFQEVKDRNDSSQDYRAIKLENSQEWQQINEVPVEIEDALRNSQKVKENALNAEDQINEQLAHERAQLSTHSHSNNDDIQSVNHQQNPFDFAIHA